MLNSTHAIWLETTFSLNPPLLLTWQQGSESHFLNFRQNLSGNNFQITLLRFSYHKTSCVKRTFPQNLWFVKNWGPKVIPQNLINKCWIEIFSNSTCIFKTSNKLFKRAECHACDPGCTNNNMFVLWSLHIRSLAKMCQLSLKISVISKWLAFLIKIKCSFFIVLITASSQ